MDAPLYSDYRCSRTMKYFAARFCRLKFEMDEMLKESTFRESRSAV